MTVKNPSDFGADESVYFAADKDSRTAVAGVLLRIRRYREVMRSTGRAEKIRKNWYAWQGYGPRGDLDASRILAGGEQGELQLVNVNHFASLVNQVVVLTTSQKPAVKAVPTSSDYESVAQATFADALNEACERDLQTALREQESALTMVLMSEVALVQDWDARVGAPVTVDELGRVVREGDVRLYSLPPFDYAYDSDAQDIDSLRWFAWRRRVSRWELAADFPELKDKLVGHTSRDVANDSLASGDTWELRRREQTRLEHRSDDIYVWELRHLPTSACPNGRLIRFVDSDTILYDSMTETADAGLPYRDAKGNASLMAVISSPERIPGVIDGHTPFFDLLSLQEGVDLASTIMASAINSGGLQNLYVPRGANVTAAKITGALNVIEYDGTTPPQAKDNVAISKEVFEWAQLLVQWMRQRVSVNDVVVGEPTRGMPAQAMALLRAQAVEFHSRLQASFEALIERNRTNVLRLYQIFAQTDRVKEVAGKGNAWASVTFSNARLDKVARFAVEPINPVMKTLAGKVGFLQPLLEAGAIPLKQYLDVVRTGRIEEVWDFDAANRARIQRDKELLVTGVGLPPVQMGPGGPVMTPDGLPAFAATPPGSQFVVPLITDTHWVDIPEALSVLATPEARQNPKLVEAVTSVVHYRLALWRAMDPALLMLLHGPPAPPPMPQGMPMGPPGPQPGPPPGPPPGPHQLRPGAPPNHAPGEPSPREEPGMPQPPRNPITGQQDQHTTLAPAPVH